MNGGKRPGAGRPKGSKNQATLSKEAAREALRAIIQREMEAMVGAQVAAAKGLKYLVARNRQSGKFIRLSEEAMTKLLAGEDDETELVEVWEKDPSTPAFTDLMNRALDKPKEQEMEVRVSGSLEVVPARLAAARKRLAGR